MDIAIPIVALFPIIFVGFWCFVVFLISQFGWAGLARHFAYREPFEGNRLGGLSGSINGMRYSHVLTVKYTEKGFYLAVLKVFRPGHPPLLIPWDQIYSVRKRKFFWWNALELELGNPRIGKFLFYQSGIKRLTSVMEQYLPEDVFIE